MIRKEFDFKILEAFRTDNYKGRFLAVKGMLNSEPFLIANIYAPNVDSPQFFEQIMNKIEETGVDRKIIGGDFNLTLEQIDRKGKGQHKNIRAKETIKQKIEQLDLIDIWRVKKPNDPGYTWRKKIPFPLFERLDFFLMSESILQMVERSQTLPAFQSDHTIVKVNICSSFPERGKGYWKFNTTLLRDKEYIEKINRLIEIQLDQSELYSSKRNHWEMIKLAIIGSTVQYSARKVKSDKNKLQVLERKLKYWEGERDSGIFADKQEDRIQKLRKDINEIYAKKNTGSGNSLSG